MPGRESSVLILGLDGATFDLILPWVEEGHLPTIGRLLEQGAASRLRSTIPPITPCAWSSFMTGKNPGKHGLFDFVEPVPGSHEMRFTNASSRHAESLWALLSRQGRRVGVVNVPMTYPPEPVNGYLISGLDTPHERSPFMYPLSLKQELRGQSIHYGIDMQHLGNMHTDSRRQKLLEEMRDLESTRTKTLKYLSRTYPADFRMIVYGSTDQIAHHFWHYMDPKHDKYDAEGAKRFSTAVRDAYAHVDRQIASILEDEDDETIVMIMSDHGFGPTTSVRLRLNQILEHHGLLNFVPERKSGRVKRALAGALDRVLRFTLSSDAKRTLAGLFPRLRVWFEGLDEAQVDWRHTTAYVHEAFRSDPGIWLNHASRGSDSVAQTDEQLEEALTKVENILRSVKDPRTGKPAISEVYRTRDVYHGPYGEQAPDLIPSWWQDGFLLEQSVPGGPADKMVERSMTPIQGGVEFSATHRLDGVFVVAGGPTKQGHWFNGADITDVAPTVLYLMGLPIPGDMDGRPLLEAFDEHFVAEHPPQFDQAGAPQPVSTQHQAFTEEEEALIAKRLQALGYIE